VQLILPLVSPQDPARRTLSIRGRTYQIGIARHRRARRYVLRVCPDGSLRLTVPRGSSIADGLAFATRQADWIERERLRQRTKSRPWVDGAEVWYRGREQPLRVIDGEIWCGAERLGGLDDDSDLRPSVEAHWRALAGCELPLRLMELAALHGLSVARVSVRNQRSRWGSCSPRRVITLNWRLIQMPEAVSDYVLLHELMHLRQPNHSRRFWREVQSVCPTWRDSERWLRKHGREIL
jgi:predicted metal-dependent hydrolase